MLHLSFTCLNHLPHTEHVFQGDFIGWGGGCEVWSECRSLTNSVSLLSKYLSLLLIRSTTITTTKRSGGDGIISLIQLFDDIRTYQVGSEPSVDRIHINDVLVRPILTRGKSSFLMKKTAKSLQNHHQCIHS